MSMTKEAIKKFVEEDFKDYSILVTTDNEHKFFHRTKGNPDVVWDWDNDCFLGLENSEDIIGQHTKPFQVTQVALDEIQFLTAFIDVPKALEFVKENYTEEVAIYKAKETIQKCTPTSKIENTLRDVTQNSRIHY